MAADALAFLQRWYAEQCSGLTQVRATEPTSGTPQTARLLGRTGRASRFLTSAAFAVYAGVAPIEIASGDKARHRLSREGDRKLNNALHAIAQTRICMPDSRGRSYYDRKIAEGKTHDEAMRCVKRHLADHVRCLMLADKPGKRAREDIRGRL